MDTTFLEMRSKDVINSLDGKKLGRIRDIVFNYNGCISGVVVPGDCKLFNNIKKDDDLFIPWKCICRIGEDVVIVEIGTSKKCVVQ